MLSLSQFLFTLLTPLHAECCEARAKRTAVGLLLFLTAGPRACSASRRGASTAANDKRLPANKDSCVRSTLYQVVPKGKDFFYILCHLYYYGHDYNGLKMKQYLEALKDGGPLSLGPHSDKLKIYNINFY